MRVAGQAEPCPSALSGLSLSPAGRVAIGRYRAFPASARRTGGTDPRVRIQSRAMGPVFAEIDIDAPREKIHDYLMDFTTRKELYGDTVDEFRLVRIKPRGVGAGARFRFTKGRAWADSSITAAEPGRISERGVSGRFNQTPTGTEWELDESTTGVTRLRVSYWTEPTGAAKLFDRLTGHAGWHSRRLRRAAGRLRDLMEADAGTPGSQVGIAGGKRHEMGVF